MSLESQLWNMENEMKQLSFVSGLITEEKIKEKHVRYKFKNITPDILSCAIRKCRLNKEGCCFSGGNICLLTDKDDHTCPRKS